MEAHAREKPVVLVTGISGLIGTRIIEAFSADYHIVGLDVKPVQTHMGEVDWIECDLTNDASARDALTTVREGHGDRLASVIHLAAYYDFPVSPAPCTRRSPLKAPDACSGSCRSFRPSSSSFPAVSW